MQNHILNASAKAIFRLPITNRPDQFVTLCELGHARAVELKVGALFMAVDGAGKHGYIRWSDMSAPGEASTFARAIMNAGHRECVRYRNRDVRDLRVSNLYITKGAAKVTSPRSPTDAGAAV